MGLGWLERGHSRLSPSLGILRLAALVPEILHEQDDIQILKFLAGNDVIKRERERQVVVEREKALAVAATAVVVAAVAAVAVAVVAVVVAGVVVVVVVVVVAVVAAVAGVV